MRKKVSTTVYLTQEQVERLKRLSERTRVPVAEYVREGVDLVLEKRRGGHMEAYRVLSAEFPGDAPGNLGERISFEGLKKGDLFTTIDPDDFLLDRSGKLVHRALADMKAHSVPLEIAYCPRNKECREKGPRGCLFNCPHNPREDPRP